MFEKKNETTETAETTESGIVADAEDLTGTDSAADAATQWGVYDNATVSTDQGDVIITVPVDESVVTIRAPEQWIARTVSETVMGSLQG